MCSGAAQGRVPRFVAHRLKVRITAKGNQFVFCPRNFGNSPSPSPSATAPAHGPHPPPPTSIPAPHSRTVLTPPIRPLPPIQTERPSCLPCTTKRDTPPFELPIDRIANCSDDCGRFRPLPRCKLKWHPTESRQHLFHGRWGRSSWPQPRFWQQVHLSTDPQEWPKVISSRVFTCIWSAQSFQLRVAWYPGDAMLHKGGPYTTHISHTTVCVSPAMPYLG
mgnify:CR=1 FL=1